MKPSRSVWSELLSGLLQWMLIIGSVLVILVVFQMPSIRPAAPATATPAALATEAVDHIPSTEWEKATLEQIRFGAPRGLIEGVGEFQIAGWMDNHRVLFTGDVENTRTLQSLDVLGGAVTRYDEGIFVGTPRWLSQSASAVYLWLNRKDNTQQVRTSSGNPGVAPLTLEPAVGLPFLFVQPNGNGVVSIAPDLKSVRATNVDATERAPAPLDLEKFAPPTPTPMEWIYRSAQSPNREWGAFFNRDHFVLLNLVTNKVKELFLPEENSEFGRGRWWGLAAAWSPNNEQIAIIATIGDLPNSFRRLYIYDLKTMQIKRLTLPTFFVLNNLAWAPNSRILLAQGDVEDLPDGYKKQGNILIDTLQDRSLPVTLLPPRRVGGNTEVELAWSPDGKSLVYHCHAPEQEHSTLCLSSVEMQP